MAIYTKTGDEGTTGLFGGARVSKSSPQIEGVGVLDEATSFIGFAICTLDDVDAKLLSDVQLNLYSIMSYLSDGPFKYQELLTHTKFLEKTIDTWEKKLPKLTRFLLPQGSEATARLHLARVIVRTAERRIVELILVKNPSDNIKAILQYMNRLSDLLFILSRKYNPQEIVT